MVRDDDFTFIGTKSDLMEVAKAMNEVYELKIRAILGDEHEDDKTITILNRKLSWDAEGWLREPTTCPSTGWTSNMQPKRHVERWRLPPKRAWRR